MPRARAARAISSAVAVPSHQRVWVWKSRLRQRGDGAGEVMGSHPFSQLRVWNRAAPPRRSQRRTSAETSTSGTAAARAKASGLQTRRVA